MSDPSFLTITRTKVLLLFSAALGIAFIISLIMVVVRACEAKPDQEAMISTEIPEPKRKSAVSVSALMFESFPSKPDAPKQYRFRERTEQWTAEQVEKYFIPPQTILHEYLSKKNDNKIREMFETIE